MRPPEAGKPGVDESVSFKDPDSFIGATYGLEGKDFRVL